MFVKQGLLLLYNYFFTTKSFASSVYFLFSSKTQQSINLSTTEKIVSVSACESSLSSSSASFGSSDSLSEDCDNIIENRSYISEIDQERDTGSDSSNHRIAGKINHFFPNNNSILLSSISSNNQSTSIQNNPVLVSPIKKVLNERRIQKT